MQRFGIYDAPVRERLGDGGRIWIQAVSVGEIFVAFRLIERLRERQPDARFVLSTNTSTGYAIGGKRVDARDVLVYFPLDFPWIMRRIIRRMRPRAILLIENEMWPNMIRQAQREGIPVALINGRISEHSFRGYSRLSAFTRRLLPMVRLFCAQSAEDAERLKLLGAPADRVRVMGSAKYDVITSDTQGEERAARTLRQAGIEPGDLLLLGCSTWPGEEECLARLYRELGKTRPRLRLMLAPRHVERREQVEQALRCEGLAWVRRSALDKREPASSAEPAVFLLDTTGELKNYYTHASVIFVGKSLTQHGGQNPIEPAFFGKAVVVGPNMENFREVMSELEQAGGVIRVADAGELERRLAELLDHDELREDWGRRAARAVRERSGALAATVDCLEKAGLV